MFRNQLFHECLNGLGTYMSSHMETMCLTRVFINNTQDSTTSTLESPVMDKIPGPYMPWIRRLLGVFSSRLPQSSLLFLRWWDLESLLSTDEPDTVVADSKVLISHQPSYFIRPPLRVCLTQHDNGPFHNTTVGCWKLGIISVRGPIELEDAASQPL